MTRLPSLGLQDQLIQFTYEQEEINCRGSDMRLISRGDIDMESPKGTVIVKVDATGQHTTGVATKSSGVIGIDLTSFRVHDNPDAFLPNAGADADDLHWEITAGSAAPLLMTHDTGGLNDTNYYGLFSVILPSWYKAGQTLTMRFHGWMGHVADQAATIDLVGCVADYANEDGTSSGDLVSTAAQDCNSVTPANYDFVIDDDATGYDLAPGDLLTFKLHVLVDDDLDAGNNIEFIIDRAELRVSA